MCVSIFSADGFLVLGHDVDRYSADDTIPVVWYEKMNVKYIDKLEHNMILI